MCEVCERSVASVHVALDAEPEIPARGAELDVVAVAEPDAVAVVEVVAEVDAEVDAEVVAAVEAEVVAVVAAGLDVEGPVDALVEGCARGGISSSVKPTGRKTGESINS